MNARLKLLGAVLRKDLRLYWPLAVATAVLILLANDRVFVSKSEVMDGVVAAATVLATGLLLLLVFHEDSAVTGRRDWLTRPLPGMTLLAGKCLFVALAVLLPEALGRILTGLHQGGAPVEVLVTSVTDGLNGMALLVFLCAMAFAALTSSVRQAILVFLAGFFVFLIGLSYLSGVIEYPMPLWFADSVGPAHGSDWVLTRTLQLLLAVTALAVLGVLYRRRHGRRAALAIIGAAVLAGGLLLVTMNRPWMFGVQKWLSPDPAAASTVALTLQPGCFPARKTPAGENSTSGMFSYQQRARAGADAVEFAVRLVVDGLPDGGQLVSRAQLTYGTTDGAIVPLGAGSTLTQWDQQWLKTASGKRVIDQYWLLPKAVYQRLAADPGVVAHVDYSLSLLAPEATAVLAADGARAYRAGIGYCDAAPNGNSSAVLVDCYRVGDQPALLAVRAEGQPDIEDRSSGNPDFTPAVLDFWGGHRHRMFVMDAAAPRVRVTAYEARAHFSRRFDVPGVLGGPASSCPSP